MPEETLVIRMSSDAAKDNEDRLEKLEKRLEAHGVADWAGTIDMAGTDFIVWLDVEVFDPDDLPDKVGEVEKHVAAVGLSEIAKVEIPEDADDDDDDDDDDEWIDLDDDIEDQDQTPEHED